MWQIPAWKIDPGFPGDPSAKGRWPSLSRPHCPVCGLQVLNKIWPRKVLLLFSQQLPVRELSMVKWALGPMYPEPGFMRDRGGCSWNMKWYWVLYDASKLKYVDTDRMMLVKGVETGGEMHGDCGGRTHHCLGKVLRCPSNVDDDLLFIMLITFI